MTAGKSCAWQQVSMLLYSPLLRFEKAPSCAHVGLTGQVVSQGNYQFDQLVYQLDRRLGEGDKE